MRKTVSIFIIAIMVLVLSSGMVNAVATAPTITFAKKSFTINQGDTITITVGLDGISDGVSAFSGKVTYNGSIFETVDDSNFTAVSPWDKSSSDDDSLLLDDDLTSLYSSTSSSSNSSTFSFVYDGFADTSQDVFKLKLIAKSNATITSDSIKFSGEVEMQDGTRQGLSSQEVSVKVSDSTISSTPSSNDSVSFNYTSYPSNNTTQANNNTNTNTNENMPTTGVEDYTLPLIAISSVVAIFAYVRYNKMDK